VTRLRILVVPKWYPWPDRPVFGIFCREHARALATRHDVVVLASLATRSPGFALFSLEDRMEDGLRTLRVRYRRPWFRPAAMACQIAGMLAALWRLRREGWRPDVVHAHVFSAGLPALLLGRLSRALVVITEHYTGFQRGLVTGADRWVARTAFERADLVAPVSHELAGHLRALAPTARIEVLPNVVDTAVFSPDGREPRHDPPRLLTVGALAQKKGHIHLLEAMARLPDARLELVGDGELREELQAAAQRLGVADRVELAGALPKERVAGLMRESDLFVLPSLNETFGCVLIEAMASGLPSVASRTGGVPEVLDEQAGELVEPADPEALADAIGRTLAREFDPGEMARSAEARYGYAAFARRWSGVYEELGSSSRGSTSRSTRAASASSR
jgi:glycosyltransferase involved in cell wall biosynthesis